MALKQADIGGMLDALEADQRRRFSLSSASSANSTHGTQRCPALDAVAVLPADLTVPLSKQNAVLVTKSTRRVLLEKLRRARKALGVRNARATPNTPNAAAQAEQQRQAEQQKQLASLWRKSIQTASLLPPTAP